MIVLALVVLPFVVHGEDDSSENTLREVRASEILDKIHKGEPVEYDHVKVIGDLDLSKLDLRTIRVNRTADEIEFSGLSKTQQVIASLIRINDSTFDGLVIFNNIFLNEAVDFSSSNFTKDAYFRGATFSGDADFSYATFSGDADFSYATFSGVAYFNAATFKEDAIFENTTFGGKLYLTRTRYNKLYIRWIDIKDALTYDDAAYMSLMKNFKDLGYFEDYDSSYFQYRREHRNQPWPAINNVEEAIRKAIDYPLEWFYGYGTKPFNAFFISLGIIILFSIVWKGLGLGGPHDLTKEKLKPDEEWLDGDITDIFGFSATVFLSGTRFFIDPPAIPKIEGQSRSLIKIAFIIERLLGALFTFLFLIAIGATVVRSA